MGDGLAHLTRDGESPTSNLHILFYLVTLTLKFKLSENIVDAECYLCARGGRSLLYRHSSYIAARIEVQSIQSVLQPSRFLPPRYCIGDLYTNGVPYQDFKITFIIVLFCPYRIICINTAERALNIE